jgi:ankyrin repeat protein
MARACLGVLLRFDSDTEPTSVLDLPLAEYAAEHFGDHAEFKGVLSHILHGLDILFDASKSHFAAWVRMCIPDHIPHTRPDVIPLYYVSARGYRSLVDYLISKRPDDVNVRGDYGTPLHAALEEAHADVAELLLGYCVDVDVRDNVDRTPLHPAAFRGFLGVTRTLVERNADINARDETGDTPLHQAMQDWFEVSESTQDGRLDVVKFLLQHGADPDAKNNGHSTPLHRASCYGSVKGAQLMLEYGANVHARNEDGQTPLHQVLSGLSDERFDDLVDIFLDTIRCLLAHGADIDALDDDHASPLHLASYWGCVTGAQLLLERGANVHLEDEKGRTPFQVASEEHHEEITKLLSGHLQSQQRM